MSYKPYLIAPFKTGLDIDLEPWMSPEDAFINVENFNLQHGFVEKRGGFRHFGDMRNGVEITAATNADPAVFTSANDVGLSVGDTVSLNYLRGGTWGTLNNALYTVTSTPTSTTFTLEDSGGAAVDGSGLGTYDSGSGILGYESSDRIMGIFRYIDSADVRQTLIANKSHVALYNGNSDYFQPLVLEDTGGTTHPNDPPLSSSDTDYIWAQEWQNPQDNNRVYLTNGQPFNGGSPGTDGLYYFDNSLVGGAGVDQDQKTVIQFRPSTGGGDLYGAKLIFALRQRLFVLNTYELISGNTINFPQRVRWCAVQDPSNWDDTVAGGGGFVDAPTGDHIISAEYLQDAIVVFFTNSVWLLRPTSDPALPFRWDKINNYRACDAKMGAVGFDRYVLSIGNRGIVATDGVETRRIDQRIESFVTDQVNSDEFDKCFGVRDYANRRMIMLYPDIESDDANGALVLDEESGAFTKYLFEREVSGNKVDLNVFGYGSNSIDYAAEDFTADNDLDVAAFELTDGQTALSFFWSLDTELLLTGDRNGKIHEFGAANTDEGTDVNAEIESASWNPFKQEGIACQMGYLDLFLDADQRTKITVYFYKDTSEVPYARQALDLLPNLLFRTDIIEIVLTDSGDPTQGLTITSPKHDLADGDQIYIYGVEGIDEVNDRQFAITKIDNNTFSIEIDATGFGSYTTGGKIFERRFYRTKVWKRAYSGGIGFQHRIKLINEGSQEPFRIHAFKPWFKPIGRRTLG